MIERIDISRIDPSPHARLIDEDNVGKLAASMGAVGLLNPICVRQVPHSNDRYEIVAGHHRRYAALALGWRAIECTVVNLDDLLAELAEIDENLVRANLSPAQAAKAIARRKEIYEELHPETKAGANASSARKTSDNLSFVSATSHAIGKDCRTVERVAARGKALGDELNAVAGTSLDKGVELDALAKMGPDERKPVIARARAGEKVSARAPAVEVAPTKKKTPDGCRRALRSAWVRSKEFQAQWMGADHITRVWFVTEILKVRDVG